MLEYEKSDLQQEDGETDMVIEDSENVYTWAQKWSSLQRTTRILIGDEQNESENL
ncbi:hypothetical protein Pmar_PMAR001347 [Perkinsus marinus ATCC 50983]|uniref:Uncharacterized protein n=1 Tax=Perkinsus marinus (strain ATCC 50983 / TXsc) TaxID=423536 RepID=C5KJG7_PERM5|nr:hypothetical protein Pmar_PMAR001347 [Perkinsus marinus ATCC 50983]EER15301.1 hypothetical protein Pmar_PMAR001347 [Perkinsus marinus ATCC 50983]|eukprot:XP_002783505.1 hypothetical protein Pmar_PMAR001347 [Perkinsus marinus ATCC 50983]